MRCSLPLLLMFGCDEGATKMTTADKPVTGGGAAKVAGVYADKFDCRSIATGEQLASLLGSPAIDVDSPAMPPVVPKACVYQSGSELWRFDFDCRDGYK